MYKHILVTLENSRFDQHILDHVEKLALQLGSELHFVHVADGWGARFYDHLNLKESEEMQEDRLYLESVVQRFSAQGLTAEGKLLLGNPPEAIIQLAKTGDYDLIAMTTHGHRFFGDLILGSTISKVRHTIDIPILLLKAPKN